MVNLTTRSTGKVQHSCLPFESNHIIFTAERAYKMPVLKIEQIIKNNNKKYGTTMTMVETKIRMKKEQNLTTKGRKNICRNQGIFVGVSNEKLINLSNIKKYCCSGPFEISVSCCWSSMYPSQQEVGDVVISYLRSKRIHRWSIASYCLVWSGIGHFHHVSIVYFF